MYRIFFERALYAKFSFQGCCIQHFLQMVSCIQHFLWKWVVYNFFLKGNDIKLLLQVPLYGRKFTFVHFHAVCRHILHVENHALSKKYFYAMLGSKKVRNFLQVWLLECKICIYASFCIFWTCMYGIQFLAIPVHIIIF